MLIHITSVKPRGLSRTANTGSAAVTVMWQRIYDSLEDRHSGSVSAWLGSDEGLPHFLCSFTVESEQILSQLKIIVFLLIPKMRGEKPPTQINTAKLIKVSILICVHGLLPPKAGSKRSELGRQGFYSSGQDFQMGI